MRNSTPTAHEKGRLSRIPALRAQGSLVALAGVVAALLLPPLASAVFLLAVLGHLVYVTCCLRCPRCSGWIVIPKCPSCGLKLDDK
jgi:hypothetical protein